MVVVVVAKAMTHIYFTSFQVCWLAVRELGLRRPSLPERKVGQVKPTKQVDK